MSALQRHSCSPDVAGGLAQLRCHTKLGGQRVHRRRQAQTSIKIARCSSEERPPHILTEEESKRTEPSAAEKGFGVTDTTGPLGIEVTEESQVAKVKQLEVLARSQQRQILEHQEALARLHAMVRETQEAQLQQSAPAGEQKQNGAGRSLRPLDAQLQTGDRRSIGLYDARFHSTSSGATPRDHRVLPKRIILVRHAESEGNIDHFAYSEVPDPQICLTERGIEQAQAAGDKIRKLMESDGIPYKMYFYMSPYRRSSQTMEALAGVFREEEIAGFQEEVQLREQDFGNFQDQEGKKREKAERMRYGRFFYRFPNGESGADVYDRMTIFEDHLVRDINAGRYSKNTSLVLVTHGLAARIFLMRWFHWTVEQFMEVYNPPNAEPVVLERIPSEASSESGGSCTWIHTKALYRLTQESQAIMKGCSDEMCSTSAMLTGVRVSDWIEED